MNSRMDEFRQFVNKYPKVRDEVRSGKKSWQNIYEDWVILGEQDPQWAQYQDIENQGNPSNYSGSNTAPNTNSNTVNLDSIKSIIGYVKKLNPDSVNRTLNSIQKVLQIAQSVNGSSKGPALPTGGGLYNDWWD